MIAPLKLLIAKLERDRFGQTSERGRRLLDQLELQLEELEADAAEAEAKRARSAGEGASRTRAKPVRGALPAHLPRERVVIAGPTECPCCHGKLSKLGETITETPEVIPRQWKVIQTVRDKFTCRSCETITQPPAPFHPIARGRAGPELLAMILEAEFGQHLPLNRQSETYAREDIHLDVSTLGDWVGACTAALAPLVALIRAHVLAGARIHGDDTMVRCWPRARLSLAGFGPRSVMTSRSAVRRRRRRCSTTRETAAASIRVARRCAGPTPCSTSSARSTACHPNSAC